MTFAIFIICTLALATALYFRLFLFLTPKNRLTILMYHQIKLQTDGPLTVSLENIEKQFRFLHEKGYDSIFFSELGSHKYKKPLIITFDDGYANNAEYLPELLKKYKLKATVFVPTELVQNGYEQYHLMNFCQIRNLDDSLFEIGLHSHKHINYRHIKPADARLDIQQNIEMLDKYGIAHSKVFAYPFGKIPEKKSDKERLYKIFEELGIDYAVRIGNKINRFPTNKKYELCRVDIRGNDNLRRFKLKMIFGKLKIF